MLRIHQPPKGEATVSDFAVLLNGEVATPWFCRVSAMPYNTVWPGCQRPMDQTEIASFLSFEMDEPIEVRLTAAKDFSELTVRPLSKGVQAKVDGREIAFTLSACGHYTVELDGLHNPLHIFANPVRDFGVDKADPNVLYYGPGVHDVGVLELQDNQTLFVDGGAVLYGSVQVIHKKNVRILGYGIIDGSREVRTDDTLLIAVDYDLGLDLRDEQVLRDYIRDRKVLNGCIHLYSSQDVEINGVITRDSSTFAFIVANCDRVSIEWAKTIGMWRYNSDGIDTFNSRYVRLANCFLRDFDDCIVLKGIDGWGDASQHHITVTGCVVWCDWGSSLEIGAETCADEYYDILWENCDVIHAAHVFMRTHNTDRAHVHDMTLRDIRCEYSKYDVCCVYQHDMNVPFDGFKKYAEPLLISSPVFDGPYSHDHILGKTSNIRYENITIYGPEGLVPKCHFSGQDAEHCNHDIVIDNVVLNGRKLTEADLKIEKSEFDRIDVV